MISPAVQKENSFTKMYTFEDKPILVDKLKNAISDLNKLLLHLTNKERKYENKYILSKLEECHNNIILSEKSKIAASDILNSINTMIAVIDFDGILLNANRAFLNKFNIKHEDFLIRNIKDILVLKDIYKGTDVLHELDDKNIEENFYIINEDTENEEIYYITISNARNGKPEPYGYILNFIKFNKNMEKK